MAANISIIGRCVLIRCSTCLWSGTYMQTTEEFEAARGMARMLRDRSVVAQADHMRLEGWSPRCSQMRAVRARARQSEARARFLSSPPHQTRKIGFTSRRRSQMLTFDQGALLRDLACRLIHQCFLICTAHLPYECRQDSWLRFTS